MGILHRMLYLRGISGSGGGFVARAIVRFASDGGGGALVSAIFASISASRRVSLGLDIG